MMIAKSTCTCTCSYLIRDTLEQVEHSERVEYLLSLAQVGEHILVPLRGLKEEVVKLTAFHSLFLLVPCRGVLLMDDLQQTTLLDGTLVKENNNCKMFKNLQFYST